MSGSQLIMMQVYMLRKVLRNEHIGNEHTSGELQTCLKLYLMKCINLEGITGYKKSGHSLLIHKPGIHTLHANRSFQGRIDSSRRGHATSNG